MNIAQTILRLLLVVACSVSGYLLASHLPVSHTLSGAFFMIFSMDNARSAKMNPVSAPTHLIQTPQV